MSPRRVIDVSPLFISFFALKKKNGVHCFSVLSSYQHIFICTQNEWQQKAGNWKIIVIKTEGKPVAVEQRWDRGARKMNKTKLDLSCWEILILWMYDFHSIKISQQFYFACFLFVALSFLLFLIKTYCRNIGLILSCSSSLPAHLIIIFSPLSCLFLYYLKTTEKMSLKIAKTKKKKKTKAKR